MKTNNLMPARTLGLGYFIREQMEYRVWDIDALSNKSGIDLSELNLLLNNKKLLLLKLQKIWQTFFVLLISIG